MDLPVEVINAVKEDKQLSLDLPKSRKPYVKKLTKRILHAVGNGLRTSSSIAKALNVPKAKIQSNMFHLKARGLVYSSKQVGSLEHKYHLTTDKPVLGQLDLTKPKRKLKAVKRATTYNKDGVNTSNSFNTPPKENINRVTEMQKDINRLNQQVTDLTESCVKLQQELVHAQAECFDLKAVIKYLERKGN
jgi:DNA-binding transcriptional MocR family regulator